MPMAEIAGLARCAACGKELPLREGRGRTRKYCNATCRSAARRRREATLVNVPDPIHRAQGTLTNESSGVNLDFVGTIARQISESAGRLAGEFTLFGGAGDPLAAMAAARELAAASEAALQVAVDQARSAGRTWREIGDALGTTRQAAFQRFGRPLDPRTGEPMTRETLPGAADKAVELLAAIVERRWEDARLDFSERMLAALDANGLARAWAVTVSAAGEYDGMGEPFTRLIGPNTVVDVPLHCEAGEMTGRVVYDEYAKVVGLWFRPAEKGALYGPQTLVRAE